MTVLNAFAKLTLALLCLGCLIVLNLSAATFVVNSTADSHDINPGDSVAADHLIPDSAFTTFRAAVEEASALPGPDTILIPGHVSPISLLLGSVIVSDNATHVLGETTYPVLDGVNNSLNDATMILAADSCVVQGVTVRRSRGDGILITGACNLVGGGNEVERVVLIGNGLDNQYAAGVAISGSSAHGNVVAGCFVGVHGNGTVVYANRNGVRIDDDAHDNLIGGSSESTRNIISGNAGYGVLISNRPSANRIEGNYIGIDASNATGPGNRLGGILIAEGSSNNVVGGDDPGDGNTISLNDYSGITLSGPLVSDNTITNNLIGMDPDGRLPLGNHGCGIRLELGAHDNMIGGSLESGNVISANEADGVHITGAGTDGNTLAGNLIGLDYQGYVTFSNGDAAHAGARIDDGASSNLIGGANESSRNTISGHIGYGIHISGAGTSDNIVSGNYIGTNGLGLSSSPNSAGVVLSNGAQLNTIGGSSAGERNIISGNRSDVFPNGCGVLIRDPGTDYNHVCGNYIGPDINGARALRNGSAGVVISSGPQYNVIGGITEDERNVISGNGSGDMTAFTARGVHIVGVNTKYNRIIGNYIGLTAAGSGTLANSGHGVGLFAGASCNYIGGTSPEEGNGISGNDWNGVFVHGSTTKHNLIRYNSIFENDSLGIALADSAQNDIRPPVIAEAHANLVSGVSGAANGTVDIYLAASDPSGEGEGELHVGAGLSDMSGQFAVPLTGVVAGDSVTATITDGDGNTSQFALNMIVDPVSTVGDSPEGLPTEFSLSQNYPNPFNPETVIAYSLPRASQVEMTVYNSLGQTVRTLLNEFQRAGDHTVIWLGDDNAGQQAASGIYFYILKTDRHSQGRKMLLVR